VTARGKTTREFLKKKPRTTGIDSELSSSKIDWFQLSEPFILFDRVFTEADVRRIDESLAEPTTN
jgi:hypothetical protein